MDSNAASQPPVTRNPSLIARNKIRPFHLILFSTWVLIAGYFAFEKLLRPQVEQALPELAEAVEQRKAEKEKKKAAREKAKGGQG